MTSNMVRRFVELTKIPWVESQMGKGVIDARRYSCCRKNPARMSPITSTWTSQTRLVQISVFAHGSIYGGSTKHDSKTCSLLAVLLH